MNEIVLQVERDSSTGLLVASWDDPASGGLSTQGKDLAELEVNIREAILCHFEGQEVPRSIRLHFTSDLVLATA